MEGKAAQTESNCIAEEARVGNEPDEAIIQECYELIRSDRPLSEVMAEVKRLSGAKASPIGQPGPVAEPNEGREATQLNDTEHRPHPCLASVTQWV